MASRGSKGSLAALFRCSVAARRAERKTLKKAISHHPSRMGLIRMVLKTSVLLTGKTMEISPERVLIQPGQRFLSIDDPYRIALTQAMAPGGMASIDGDFQAVGAADEGDRAAGFAMGIGVHDGKEG